jgi:hypothetical protein
VNRYACILSAKSLNFNLLMLGVYLTLKGGRRSTVVQEFARYCLSQVSDNQQREREVDEVYDRNMVLVRAGDTNDVNGADAASC